jgi:hypothetical protein
MWRSGETLAVVRPGDPMKLRAPDIAVGSRIYRVHLFHDHRGVMTLTTNRDVITSAARVAALIAILDWGGDHPDEVAFAVADRNGVGVRLDFKEVTTAEMQRRGVFDGVRVSNG